MTPCWSCHGRVEGELLCPACHILQPPRPDVDFFTLFGLERGFEVERERLEERYRAMQQQVHPDRFATRTATERRYSLEHVTRLNEGYRTLLQPLARGEYLLRLLGHVAHGENRGMPSDPAFLLEVMELREALEEVHPRAADAPARLARLRREVEQRLAGELGAFAAQLPETPAGDPARLAGLARHLDRCRFHNRFLEEVERKEEQLHEEAG